MSNETSRFAGLEDATGAQIEPRSYVPAAIASAVAVIRAAVCEESARLVEALLLLRPPGGSDDVDVAALGEAAGFAADDESIWEWLEAVDCRFVQSFGLGFMTRADQNDDIWSGSRLGGDAGCDQDRDASAVRPSRLELSAAFRALLDKPHQVPETTNLPVPDAVTTTWVAILQAAPRAQHGHHVALRVVSGEREVADFAGLVAAGGGPVSLISDATHASLAAAIFRSELHAGEEGHVVVIASDVLVETSSSDAGADDYDEPMVQLITTCSKTSALPWLRGLRTTYVWRVPATAELPRSLDGFLGGCIGPLGFDRVWSEGVIAAMAPGIGAKGATALLAQVRDPRNASAMAAMVRTAATRSSADDACALVARSFGTRRGGLTPALAPPPAFDPRLLVCDDDVGTFFDRADALAQNGARLLFWGPPGGGKSSLAQALARQMVGHPTIMVTPADVLAYRWGAMERRLAALWSRAANEGAVLVIDELDSLCAARDSGGSNDYLIRCLTDEMIRHFDAHPSVPLLATVNDPTAIDDAVRRRFAFVVQVLDELTPDRERLAWTSILGIEPPVGWTPCGASVADVALANARCRMLGLSEPASLAHAVVRARSARLGLASKRRTRTASSLH